MSCGLYLNQLPIIDNNVVQSQIFWVGLSAIKFAEEAEKLPLASSTRTGALIETIETPLRKKYFFYKTNLVKCPPLKNEKIRYPDFEEMERCYSNFERELEVLKPTIVFLLGSLVSKFVMKKFDIKYSGFPKDFKYSGIKLNETTTLIPVHHPSYILVYKRKLIDQYVKSLRKICKTIDAKKSILSDEVILL